MGRNSFSGKSQLIFKVSNATGAMETLGFVADDTKQADENLKDCLQDHLIDFKENGTKDRLVFFVNDGEVDHDFDWELIYALSPYLENHSFYESEGDGLYVLEIVDGQVKVNQYEQEFDEASDTEIGRTLVKAYFWDEEYADDDDDFEFDEARFRLLASQLVVPKENLEGLNKQLSCEKKVFKGIPQRVLHCLKQSGWILRDETPKDLFFELSPEAFVAEVEHPGSRFIYENMSFYKYGAALRRNGSFLEFQVEEGRNGVQTYRLTIESRQTKYGMRPHFAQQALSHVQDRFYQVCPVLVRDTPKDPLQVDSAHWRPQDKAWAKKRAAQWKEVERTLGREKTKKGMNVVKQYFLKGKLPDWEKLNESWNDEDTHGRHLDLFSLLYCHPVQDYDVLKPLRDAYLAGESFGRSHADVFAGSHTFLALGLRDASRNGKEYGLRKHFICDAEMMTRLMFEGGLHIDNEDTSQSSRRCGPDIYALTYIESWLALDELNEYGSKMIMQHDLMLELMYENVCVLEGRNRREVFLDYRLPHWERILYGLHHYDHAKEGDTVRAQVVRKLTGMLDERDWGGELDELWVRVKGDKHYGRGLDDPSTDPLQLDRSFWKTRSKKWRDERAEQWPRIAKLLKLTKKKDGLEICRAYYLQGELPKWSEVRKIWEKGSHRDGHLDLFSILFLHPSDDYAVLQPLRDQYLRGRWHGRKGLDLLAGFRLFKTLGFECPCVNGMSPYSQAQRKSGTYGLGEKAELMTRLFFEIIDQPFGEDDLRAEFRADAHRDFEFMRDRDYQHELVRLVEWLRLESLNKNGNAIIYRYPIALKGFLDALSTKLKDSDIRSQSTGWRRVLAEIHDFDKAKEGPDSARTIIVEKLRDHFDQPERPELVRAMWEDIKVEKAQAETS